MKNNVYLILILLFSINVFTQNDRTVITGIIIADSSIVKDVHIINKISNKATVSNKFGEFQIPVKVGDILIFSAVQFESKQLIINRKHLEKLLITIQLKLKINKIDEVVVQKPKNIAKELGLPNAGKKPLNRLENRLNSHTKAIVPLAILGTLLGQAGGIDNLYYIFSGNRKRDRKLKKLIDNDAFNFQKQKDIQKIRTHFKDDFFTQTLKIPEKEINYFIDYCISKDIVNLYNKQRILVITDIFIKESTVYLKKLENDNK